MPEPVNLQSRPMPVACFAPPLTDEKLARYKVISDELPESGGLRYAFLECLKAVELWWELPESKGGRKDQTLDIKHRGRDVGVKVTTLTPDLTRQLDPAVPWDYELAAMGKLFDTIDPVADKELRDAAFHVLWLATELERGREPLTLDKLPTE